MNTITTNADDIQQELKKMVRAQKEAPGFAMNSYFYRSNAVFKRELDRLIFRSWMYAAHVSEIPESGNYVLLEVGEDSIIIARDQDGKVQALHNICRHRGSRVCEHQSGKRKTFVCPYHGWSYNLDGTLRPARNMEVLEGFDRNNFSLKSISVEVYMGLIFVNFNSAAPAFTLSLDKIKQPLGAYKLQNAKVVHQNTYKVNANWKLCLENYLECYHCASSHKKYSRIHTLKDLSCNVSHLNDAMLARAEEITGVKGIGNEHEQVYLKATDFGSCVASNRYALYDGYLTGSEDGQAIAPLMGNMKGYDGGAGDFQMGPVTFMLNYPDHCVLYRFLPRGLTETDMKVVWFVNGDAEEGVDYNIEKLTWLWHETTQEDEYIIMRNSEGVNSKFFSPGPYHPEHEALCIKFVEWYLSILDDELT